MSQTGSHGRHIVWLLCCAVSDVGTAADCRTQALPPLSVLHDHIITTPDAYSVMSGDTFFLVWDLHNRADDLYIAYGTIGNVRTAGMHQFRMAHGYGDSRLLLFPGILYF